LFHGIRGNVFSHQKETGQYTTQTLYILSCFFDEEARFK